MTSRWVRLVADCLPALCMLTTVTLLTMSVWRASRALDGAHRVHEMQESVVASIVAEEAAFAALDELDSNEPVTVQGLSSMISKVGVIETDWSKELSIEVTSAKGKNYYFSCELLPGAAPRSLASPLSIRHDVVVFRPKLQSWLRSNLDVHFNPMTEDQTLESVLDIGTGAKTVSHPNSAEKEQIRTHDSIGLLRLPAGTDRRDFCTEEVEPDVWRPRVPSSGVIVVEGNLWFERSDRPLSIELESSLTLVVNGNIYIGRSIVVTRGKGRLILVANNSGLPGFRDVDGSGGWSAGDKAISVDRTEADDSYIGPVEGVGSIYLGLPGGRPAQDLEVFASLVSGGEVYVSSVAASVHGAMVVGQGITWFGDSELRLPGDRLPNTQREKVPGFNRSGHMRPGLLVESK